MFRRLSTPLEHLHMKIELSPIHVIKRLAQAKRTHGRLLNRSNCTIATFIDAVIVRLLNPMLRIRQRSTAEHKLHNSVRKATTRAIDESHMDATSKSESQERHNFGMFHFASRERLGQRIDKPTADRDRLGDLSTICRNGRQVVRVKFPLRFGSQIGGSTERTDD
jgi:hypothetical protein